MRYQGFLCVFLTVGGSLAAGPAPLGITASGNSAAEFLLVAAQANQGLYTRMESFVCLEQIERFKGHGRPTDSGKHIDTVTATVSLENGIEQYSNIQQKKRPLPTLTALDGAWSEGEFGTLLKQTEPLLLSQRASFEAEERVGMNYAAIYSFDVASEESPWDLTVGGRHYAIPFHTRVWVAEPSGEILKIQRTSLAVPAELGIASIYWNVTLGAVAFSGGKEWLLPESAEYQVAYRQSGRVEWNTMKFSDYRRYGSEVALRFN